MEPQNVSVEATPPEPAEPVLTPDTSEAELAIAAPTPAATEPKPSYVKLAMRNMVRKRGLSLQHFTLTTIGLLAFFVGLAYLTR